MRREDPVSSNSETAQWSPIWKVRLPGRRGLGDQKWAYDGWMYPLQRQRIPSVSPGVFHVIFSCFSVWSPLFIKGIIQRPRGHLCLCSWGSADLTGYPSRKWRWYFQCFLLSFLGSFQDFGEFAYTHTHGKIPLNLASGWFAFIWERRLSSHLPARICICYLFPLSADMQIFYRKLCRPYLAFFI